MGSAFSVSIPSPEVNPVDVAPSPAVRRPLAASARNGAFGQLQGPIGDDGTDAPTLGTRLFLIQNGLQHTPFHPCGEIERALPVSTDGLAGLDFNGETSIQVVRDDDNPGHILPETAERRVTGRVNLFEKGDTSTRPITWAKRFGAQNVAGFSPPLPGFEEQRLIRLKPSSSSRG